MNDLRHYVFQHRIPLEKVTTLGICGDVSIDFFGLCEVSKKNQNKTFIPLYLNVFCASGCNFKVTLGYIYISFAIRTGEDHALQSKQLQAQGAHC